MVESRRSKARSRAQTFKIVILGEGRVGKTSLSLRFVHGAGSFDKN